MRVTFEQEVERAAELSGICHGIRIPLDPFISFFYVHECWFGDETSLGHTTPVINISYYIMVWGKKQTPSAQKGPACIL